MAGKQKIEAANVDDYIAAQPEAFQPALREMRAIVKSEVPEAQEVLSYGVLCFRQQKNLVGIGATKSAASFYTMSPELVARMKDELAGVKVSGATLHFPPGKPLPETLLRTLIRARLAESAAASPTA